MMNSEHMLREGFKKKSGIFQIFSKPTTHPSKIRKSGKKNKNFIILKSFLGNFEQFLKKYFFHPKNVKTLRIFFFILLSDWPQVKFSQPYTVWSTEMVQLTIYAWYSQTHMQCGQLDAWSGWPIGSAADSKCQTPPLYGKK